MHNQKGQQNDNKRYCKTCKGVSFDGVRVLNNNGLVKEETKQRILKIVEESKFVPNAFARSLSNESLINNVGLIVPNIDNPFFAAGRGRQCRGR